MSFFEGEKITPLRAVKEGKKGGKAAHRGKRVKMSPLGQEEVGTNQDDG